MNYKSKILALKSKGYSNTEIAKLINCNRSTVNYHCSPNGRISRNKAIRKYRKKTNYNKLYNRKNITEPILRKLRSFINRKISYPKRKNLSSINEQIYNKLRHFHKRGNEIMTKVPTLDEVKSKIGNNPICYLTGQQIDLSKPNTYQFDHIVPTSRGGNNTIENLGICTKQANKAKSDMTPDELILFCTKVLNHNGYNVTKL